MLPLPADLIDVNAAARILGVHVSAIYRWIGSNKLTAWRVGGRWKLSRKDVEAFPQRSGPGADKGGRPATQTPTHAEAMALLRARGYAD